jgi:GT2 family glycosyltransferase
MILPTVVAIVPTYNRQEKLIRFLRLFSQQTYPNLHIIVVDSHSTDRTPEIVAQEFPQVTLVRVSDREFWTGATNAGVKLALSGNLHRDRPQGRAESDRAQEIDFILTINDDAVVEVDHVEKLVNLAQKHQLKILGSRIDYLEPQNKVWSLGTYSDWGSDRILTIAYNDVELSSIPTDILSQEIIPVDAMPGNGVLIHRSVFDRVGLYNARFLPHYHADSELIMRAHQRGIQAWLAPQIVLYNDFNLAQKKVPLTGWAGLRYTFFHPKSHLLMLPIAYLIWRYCPPSQIIPTLTALAGRFKRMKTNK